MSYPAPTLDWSNIRAREGVIAVATEQQRQEREQRHAEELRKAEEAHRAAQEAERKRQREGQAK